MTGNSHYIKPIVFTLDLVIVNISLLLVAFWKFDSVAILFEEPYSLLYVGSNVFWIMLELIIKPFHIKRTMRYVQYVRKYTFTVLMHFLLITAFSTLIKFSNISREFLILGFTTEWFLMMLLGGTLIWTLRAYRKNGYNYRNVIIAGHGELSKQLEILFRAHPEYGYRIKRLFGDEQNQKVSDLSTISEYINNEDIDEVYCCVPYLTHEKIRELIDYAEDRFIKVKLITDFRGFPMKGLTLERYGHIPVLNVTEIPLDDIKNRVIKRTFDIAFSSLVMLLVFSWLFPIIGLLIKLESRGPVFFKQKRTGKDGKSFWCYKFRSMAVNSDSDSRQATKGDMRITKVGAFIRKTSIDEFPQFINVLKGEMSVVGPRPHMLKHTEEYSKIIEKFMTRHFVKPGITGLAQAKGYRGETEGDDYAMKGRVKLDRFYVENWSLYFDVKIIVLTGLSIVKGDENAY
ncbi:undecaprenyl-phosphate glucose phosphotransferase [Sediminitomix flava]|uniref:Putative colanic acid biosynthesis UDP-glucose lipid carrier transferase n=1 Tax=Sediminitomix flava TaxID=379075 RepID=A0A315Z902_SEDFL|nr:undecaprenyl-phosphate glucose phosphotransferase [Sediminitomix flava]PWJ40929.1 putative colanic acid biosynthesis UDP-glucose lipid carrier transferase [Sediminitomix flava]